MKMIKSYFMMKNNKENAKKFMEALTYIFF